LCVVYLHQKMMKFYHFKTLHMPKSNHTAYLDFWLSFQYACLLHHFLNIPVYCSEAHTATQNTSTTLSTTLMHTEILHILNNDHTFGVTDTGKNSALWTYVQKNTFGKTVHLQGYS
jgi:hypothetical protein